MLYEKIPKQMFKEKIPIRDSDSADDFANLFEDKIIMKKQFLTFG